MTFLIDNQLPQTLAHIFAAHGFKAEHVLDLRLDDASDKIIWDYATQNNSVIVTKHEDFVILSLQQGGKNQVVWVRLGNCRKQALFAVFESAMPKLIQALKQGSRVIELQ